MTNPQDFPRKSSPDPEPNVPNRKAMESEEAEMLKNDPAERPVSAVGMDQIAESGDRDPLLGSATSPMKPAGRAGDVDEATGARDAEEERIRPGDRKHGRE
jgi:hypothetical protein